MGSMAAPKTNNGIHSFYQHIQTDKNDPDSAEPALILARRSFGKGCAFVICLSGLHRYTDDHFLMHQAQLAAKVLGLDSNSKFDVMPIADMIINGIDGLVNMPPEALEQMEIRARRHSGGGSAVIGINGKSFEVEH